MKKLTEKTLFFIVVLINTYPVLKYHYFPTLDGPQHLYNARLMLEMFQGNSYLSDFFQWNHFPVPNYTGHALLALFQLFLKPYLAEKLLLVIYVTGLPYAFRFLINTLPTKQTLTSFLIFPFVYSYMFYLGFYNFSLALILLFFTIGLWIKFRERLTFLRGLLLFFLCAITYFSHLSVFLTLVVSLFSVLVYFDFVAVVRGDIRFKKLFIEFLIKSVKLIIIVAFPLLLSLVFLAHRPDAIANEFLPVQMLKNHIVNIQTIIAFVTDTEASWTRIIFYTVVFLMVVTLAIKIIDFIKERKLHRLISTGDYWLLASLFFLTAYFYLPNSDGWAGYFSFRLLLFAFLFMLLWFASHNIPAIIMIAAIIVVSYSHFQLQKLRDPSTKSLNETAMMIEESSHYIQKNSSIISIDNSGNWIQNHFYNYVGLNKSCLLLNNGEPMMSYFPLVWQLSEDNYWRIDNSGKVDSCHNINHAKAFAKNKIDYLLILGDFDTTDVCKASTYHYLQEKCDLVFKKEMVRLYKNTKDKKPD
jgi:hypothetical protein